MEEVLTAVIDGVVERRERRADERRDFDSEKNLRSFDIDFSTVRQETSRTPAFTQTKLQPNLCFSDPRIIEVQWHHDIHRWCTTCIPN